MITTLTIILSLVYILYGGVVWRLRGGAIGNIISIGTTKTRIITMTLLTIPLVIYTFNPWYLILILTLWLGLVIAGLGPYFHMGRANDGTGWKIVPSRIEAEGNIGTPRDTWMDFLPRILGVKQIHGWWWDFWGMVLCGFMAPSFTFIAMSIINHSIIPLLFIIPLSFLFPVVYEIAWRIPVPSKSRFPKWLQTHFPDEQIDYGEFMWGMVMSLFLLLGMLIIIH
mgnify:CR=1 FL=1|jgi:hypothetical protein